MASARSYEEEAQIGIPYDLIFGFNELAAVRCAIELGIPEILENGSNGDGAVTLAELASALGCMSASLYRLMRFLTHRGIFKESETSPVAYTQTAKSRLLLKNNMGPLLLFASSPETVTMKFNLSKYLIMEGGGMDPFERTHGAKIWEYSIANPAFAELFNNTMACLAKTTISTVIENCVVAFEGIASLVNVGGGNGTVSRILMRACPWITRVINFDQPHVVSSLVDEGPMEHIGGDMFQAIPSADAALVMNVLHDWDDEACIKILKKCKEAIPRDGGKVIIVDIVIGDESKEYKDVQLSVDMEMMSITGEGKERNSKEWDHILTAAGFIQYTIKPIPAPQSVILAYH